MGSSLTHALARSFCHLLSSRRIPACWLPLPALPSVHSSGNAAVYSRYSRISHGGIGFLVVSCAQRAKGFQLNCSHSGHRPLLQGANLGTVLEGAAERSLPGFVSLKVFQNWLLRTRRFKPRWRCSRSSREYPSTLCICSLAMVTNAHR